MENKEKRGPGRPKIEVDLDEVRELAAEGNTCAHIAAALGFSQSTLFLRKDVRAAYDAGRAELCVNLRHWQLEAAKSGNTQMLIWLGKQYLGQSDIIQKDTNEVEDLTPLANMLK